MDESHEPLQLVKQLRQVLAADKLSVGFLLGAGCPCSIRIRNEQDGSDTPLIPGIDGLTDIVSNALSESLELGPPFRQLCATLDEDGFTDLTVELLLSRIRSLRDAAGSAEVRGLSAQHLANLDRHICNSISTIVTKNLPTDDTPYHSLARFVGSLRIPPSEIFTTNYDLLAEQALESLQVPFFDGFVGASRPFFDQHAIEDDSLPNRWALLWKLHGSINWRFNRISNTVVRSERPSDGDELLIHPSHLKYDESRRMPYLVMIDRLRTFLRNHTQPVALFIVGHSFSDDHLNATILESLKANPSAACYALQFAKLSEYPEAANLAKRETNLSVLATDAAIVRRRPGRWLAKPATDPATISPAFEFSEANEQDASSRAEGLDNSDADSDSPRPCSFLLGNFKHFGRFLDDVAGYSTAFGDQP